jgi:thiol-disulfide isomerase/thioredoxin
VAGTLTSFREGEFELTREEESTVKVPLANVVGVDFSRGFAGATIERTTKKPLAGKIWLIARDQVHFENDKGETIRIPLHEVAKMEFSATPPPKAAATALAKTVVPEKANAKPTTDKIQLISTGEKVELAPHCVAGKVTIVDFYADWCPPCRQVGPMIEKLVKDDPDLVIRKINIGQWGTPVATQYKLTGVPFLQVYNRQGEKVGEMSGYNPAEFGGFIEKAKQQDRGCRDLPLVNKFF